MTETWASSLAGRLVVDVDDRLAGPTQGRACASAACRSARGSPVRTVSACGAAGGRPGSNEPSTSRPQTFS